MSEFTPHAIRPNSTKLTSRPCPTCHASVLAGLDHPRMALYAIVHPATLDHANAQAALILGHIVYHVSGSWQHGWNIENTYRPERYTRLPDRAATWMVAHQCQNQPDLDYEPAPPSQDDTTVDLFDTAIYGEPPY